MKNISSFEVIYISKNNKLRSTIDTNIKIKSFKINNRMNIPIRKEIMELKYDVDKDLYFRNTFINKNFNFRFQKFSKYVVGVINLKKNGLI